MIPTAFGRPPRATGPAAKRAARRAAVRAAWLAVWPVAMLAAGAAPAQEAAGPAEPSLAAVAAVTALGRLNGQALACQEAGAARRAKALMLTHAPKTARFGQAFQDATQQAFVATTRGDAACPSSPALDQALDGAARALQAVLPGGAR